MPDFIVEVPEPEFYECPECGADYEYEGEALSCCAVDDWGPGPFDGEVHHLPALPDPVYLVGVPAIWRRPARLTSIEQEVVFGGASAARTLESYGLSQYSQIVDHSDDGVAQSVVVKEDGSLPDEGGEFVYSRFDLSQKSQAENLSEILCRVRQMKEARIIGSGDSAGVHIHISAKAQDGSCIGPGEMANLHELFCHLEDMLYAFAAAGWQQHRLDTEYSNDDGYCKVLPKHDEDEKPTVAKTYQLMRYDRYYGLNFQRLFEGVRSCTCGACSMGAWSECDCGSLKRATVEWRLFNSSTKPETLHAWLLIAHAITAYASQHRLGSLKPTTIRTGTSESRWEQLEWVLRKCPFTDKEREIVRDTARRAPGFGQVSESY